MNFELLKECLSESGQRFSHYQEIPVFVQSALPASLLPSDYTKRQINLDGPRLRFLADYLNLQDFSVIEIGSSLGYLDLSLAHEFSCRCIGYEPIESYAKASTLMAQAAGLDELCQFHGYGINLSDIANLPEADLVIELNVLHHSGAIFDQAEVDRLGGWRAYAVARLSALREKGSRLFFQTGNTANGTALFSSEEAIVQVHDLLQEAGWRPQHIGVVQDLDQLTYNHIRPEDRTSGRTYVCRRNIDTGLVDYYVNGHLAGSLSTGLANRPIWICN